jgi:4-azaleucine resistance transporter AzlC
MKCRSLAAAFPYTVPVLMGYLSIGIVFGWMLSAIGYNPLWSVAMSLTIYAGSGQYLGVDLLANATPLADVAFLTLVINFRHLVYGLSMLEKFKGMGPRKLYMIFALTDETYALLAGVQAPDGVDEKDFYFTIAVLDHIYWILGSLIGAVAGSLIHINTDGIDFAMTALFIVIAIEQWQSAQRHFPVFLGAVGTLVCLLWLGPDGGRFLIPALGILVAGLLLARPVLDSPKPEAPTLKGGDRP